MPAIGASGILGVAIEAASGTYLAPTTFIPIVSESLKWVQGNTERRNIRNTAALNGMTKGHGHVEGDVVFEGLTVNLLPFLVAARTTVVKTGATAPYTYTFTPNSNAVATKTLSITVKRGGQISNYTGCTVGSLTLTIDADGKLQVTASIIGRNETDNVSALTPTWPTEVPFGIGDYTFAINGANINDSDTVEVSITDNASAENRITATPGAAFVKFGENSVSVKTTRDFEDRTDLDRFKAVTALPMIITASRGANQEISIAVPVGFISSYEYGLSSVGDLIRASLEYVGAIDGTGNSYTITVKSSANLTLT